MKNLFHPIHKYTKIIYSMGKMVKYVKSLNFFRNYKFIQTDLYLVEF